MRASPLDRVSIFGVSRGRLALGVLGLATLLGAADVALLYASLALEARGRRLGFLEIVAVTVPSWYVSVLFLPALFCLAERFPLERARWRRALGAHGAGSVAFAAAQISASMLVCDYLLFPGRVAVTPLENLARLFAQNFTGQVAFYWGIVGTYHALHIHRRLRRREREAAELEVRASRLEASLARARLLALQMQLRPHFLFNALNTVRMLATRQEHEKVVGTIVRLSEFLRIALRNTTHIVPLRSELEFTRAYLEIEEVRFRGRLSVRYDVEPALLDAPVPTFLLQPLVENAVLHGVGRRRGAGTIEVRARRAGSGMEVWVRDDGPGFAGADALASGGVGLGNVRSRLEQVYGDEARLELENPPEGGALVRIVLPLTPRRFVSDWMEEIGGEEASNSGRGDAERGEEDAAA